MWKHIYDGEKGYYSHNMSIIIAVLIIFIASHIDKGINVPDISTPSTQINLSTKALKLYYVKAGISPRGNTALYAKKIIQTFPPEQRVNALKIVMCESSFIHNNINVNKNGTKDYGLFQINSGRTLKGLKGTPKDALNPNWNIKAAYKLYKNRGWSPWVCAKKLKLRNHKKINQNE